MTPRTYPILPLEFWRREIGYNPWHFWGLADQSVVPVTSKCNDVVREYSWQATDEAGRADIRQAIINAEDILLQHMGFWPAPIYTDNTKPWPRHLDQRQQNIIRSDIRGGRVPVQMDEGYILECGIEARSLLDADAALVYTDSDSDGLKDTFTITVPTILSDPTEIAIYFSAANRYPVDDDISDRWRIDPVHVVITGGNAIITGRRWQVVRPVLYENAGGYPIDPTVDANFITVCDVYRRYTYKDGDDSQVDSQAALIWESRPCTWGCSPNTNGSSDPASEGWVAGRAGVRDSLNGIVTPAEAVYNATSGLWSSSGYCFSQCNEPDKVLVRYLAGYPVEVHGWMQPVMRTLVARLACAEMTRRICSCDQANREWSNWQFDVSRVNAPEQYQASLQVLDNPIGTRRGHIYAWQRIQSLARVAGVLS